MGAGGAGGEGERENFQNSVKIKDILFLVNTYIYVIYSVSFLYANLNLWTSRVFKSFYGQILTCVAMEMHMGLYGKQRKVGLGVHSLLENLFLGIGPN